MGADTLALLSIIVAFADTFSAVSSEKMLDKKGLRFTLFFEGIYLAAISLVLAFLAKGFEDAFLPQTRIMMLIACILYIIAMMMDQVNMIHAYLVRSLAVSPNEITKTLSVGFKCRPYYGRCYFVRHGRCLVRLRFRIRLYHGGGSLCRSDRRRHLCASPEF